jgi:hypothetical protein
VFQLSTTHHADEKKTLILDKKAELSSPATNHSMQA